MFYVDEGSSAQEGNFYVEAIYKIRAGQHSGGLILITPLALTL